MYARPGRVSSFHPTTVQQLPELIKGELMSEFQDPGFLRVGSPGCMGFDDKGYFWWHRVGAADFTDATRKPVSSS